MTKDCKTTKKKKQTPVFFFFLGASLLNKQGGHTHAVGGVAALFFCFKMLKQLSGQAAQISRNCRVEIKIHHILSDTHPSMFVCRQSKKKYNPLVIIISSSFLLTRRKQKNKKK